MMSVASQKRRSFSAHFSRANRWKSAEARPEEYGKWSNCSLLRNSWPKPTGVQEHCRLTEKPTVGSPFLGAFPSDRIRKATEDVSVHFFIYSTNCCKLYQRIPGTFWSHYVHWRTFPFTRNTGLRIFRLFNPLIFKGLTLWLKNCETYNNL